MNTDPTRPAPSAIMAEKAILSTLMQYPGDFIARGIAEGLTDESFSTPATRLFFRSMVDDFHAHGDLEMIAFVQRRQTDGTLDRMGGPAEITHVYTYAPSPGGWQQWIGQVKESHALRIALASAHRLAEAETSDDAAAEVSGALEAIKKATEGPRRSLDARTATADFLTALEADYKAGELPGQSTGFHELDSITGGMRPGELHVYCAKSTRGKTALMLQVGAEFLTAGKRVAIFSIELMTKEVVGRLACVIGRVNFGAITQPRTATSRDMDGIKRAVATMAASRLHIDASAGQTLDSIRSEAQRLRDMHGGLDLVVVDYIQICGVDRVKNDMREREIARISGGLKQLAKELNCPVLTASQLNDAGQTRESRAIEQDADVLLYITEDGIKIGKNRNGRRNDVLPLFLNGAMQRFTLSKP